MDRLFHPILIECLREGRIATAGELAAMASRIRRDLQPFCAAASGCVANAPGAGALHLARIALWGDPRAHHAGC